MGPLRAYFEDRKLDAELWCRNRSPYLRAALAAYLIYAGVRHIAQADYRSWFGGITLAFHEMGHLLFSYFGETLTILGGSVLQLVVPLAATFYLLLRQRDHFGFAVGAAWLSTSLWELALYVYDAPRQQLPLVGFGDDPQHDWATLLTRWHLLNHSDTFASLLRVAATLTWLAAMTLAVWLCITMWRLARSIEHA